MGQFGRVGVLLVFMGATGAHASRAQLTISCPTISSGAGVSTSASLSITATMGQPIIGITAGTTVYINAGFVLCDSVGRGSVSSPAPLLPGVTRLTMLAPNPFESRAAISFDIASAAITSVRIYDATGREVHTLIDARLEPGRYNLEWNGTDLHGAPVGPGIYFCRFSAGDKLEVRRIALVR